jgi:topoisomerase IV subunit A
MRSLEEELKEIEYNLAHIIEYSIKYYQNLLQKYGKGRERKTEIRTFDVIAANIVAANNQKLYVNRVEGFIGYGIKKDEYVTDCSDIDDIIVFRRDGNCIVTKISEKVFVGKDIIYVGVFKKNDERMVYNMIYLDGKSGRSMVKRFQVLAVTRDREYDLTTGQKGSKILYFSANPNGEAEIVTVTLTSGAKARIKVFDFEFSTIEIKGRAAQGNILTKYPVKKIQFKTAGTSTLGGLDIWYDDSIGRLNTDNRGKFIGKFAGEDNVIVFTKDGSYELTNFELTNRYEPEEVMLIEKFNPNKVVSAVYYDGASKTYFVKRFKIETSTLNKKFLFISDVKSSHLVVVSTDKQPQIEIEYTKPGSKAKETSVFDFDMLIDVKGWKSIGNKLSNYNVTKVKIMASKVEDDVEKDVSGGEEEGYEPGSTVDLDLKKKDTDDTQLGLF